MSSPRRRRLVAKLGIGCAVMALAAFTALALAHSNPAVVSSQATVPAANFDDPTYPVNTAKVRCSDGFHPRNAGWAGDVDPNLLSGNADVLPQAMRYKGGVWKVEGSNEGQSDGTIMATQRCAKSSLKLKAVTVTKKLKPGGESKVKATCPKGKEVLGGGFDSGTTATHQPSSFFYGSKRTSSRTWTVFADYPPPAKSATAKDNPRGSVSSIAYCGKGPKITAVSDSVVIQPGDTSGTAVKCPKGTTLVFGSAVGDVDAVGQTKAVFPSVSLAQNDHEWQVEGLNFIMTTKPGKLTGYAYCA